jgi:hypothetical protein
VNGVADVVQVRRDHTVDFIVAKPFKVGQVQQVDNKQ